MRSSAVTKITARSRNENAIGVYLTTSNEIKLDLVGWLMPYYFFFSCEWKRSASFK